MKDALGHGSDERGGGGGGMSGEEHTQAIAAQHGIQHPIGTATDSTNTPRLFDLKPGMPEYESPFSDREKDAYAQAYDTTPAEKAIEGLK